MAAHQISPKLSCLKEQQSLYYSSSFHGSGSQEQAELVVLA